MVMSSPRRPRLPQHASQAENTPNLSNSAGPTIHKFGIIAAMFETRRTTAIDLRSNLVKDGYCWRICQRSSWLSFTSAHVHSEKARPHDQHKPHELPLRLCGVAPTARNRATP